MRVNDHGLMSAIDNIKGVDPVSSSFGGGTDNHFVPTLQFAQKAEMSIAVTIDYQVAVQKPFINCRTRRRNRGTECQVSAGISMQKNRSVAQSGNLNHSRRLCVGPWPGWRVFRSLANFYPRPLEQPLRQHGLGRDPDCLNRRSE